MHTWCVIHVSELHHHRQHVHYISHRDWVHLSGVYLINVQEREAVIKFLLGFELYYTGTVHKSKSIKYGQEEIGEKWEAILQLALRWSSLDAT